MSEEPRRTFADMISGVVAAQQASQKKAHAHAEEFGRALRDEIAAARRVGACEACIANELVQATADRLVEDYPGGTEQLITALDGTISAITAALMAAVVRREAARMNKAAMEPLPEMPIRKA